MYEFTTLGAIVGLVTGNMKNTIQITEFGLNNVIGISILLIGTGTIAGILMVAATVHTDATVVDSLPHGSFFHATGGAVKMSINDRMKLIPYEALIGLTSTVLSIVWYLI